MQIQTLSAVIGTKACDAGCPFCVSAMTGFDELPRGCPIDRLGFQKAMRWAEIGDCTTCLLTGKGEPTLYPFEVTEYLRMLNDRFQSGRGFPSLEIQTNALRIGQIAQMWWDGSTAPYRGRNSLLASVKTKTRPLVEDEGGVVYYPPSASATTSLPVLNNGNDVQDELVVVNPPFTIPFSLPTDGKNPQGLLLRRLLMEMYKWKALGLDYIAISVVDIKRENNKKIYLHHRNIAYPRLEVTVAFLHAMGFRVRLCVMMHEGMVDTPQRLEEVLQWCRENEVEQCTARPIRKPTGTIRIEDADDFTKYLDANGIGEDKEAEFMHWIRNKCRDGKARILRTLMHGQNEVKVYDVEGQNLCLSDCLTMESTSDDIRTLIVYADGDITYDWVHRGARLR